MEKGRSSTFGAETIVYPDGKKKREERRKKKRKRKELALYLTLMPKLSQIDCILKCKGENYITSRRKLREKSL